MTAYVLVQRLGGQLSDTVTITQAHLVPGSTAGLRKDDVWTLENLLYGMLLVSGNDAALAVADHVGRTIHAELKVLTPVRCGSEADCLPRAFAYILDKVFTTNPTDPIINTAGLTRSNSF